MKKRLATMGLTLMMAIASIAMFCGCGLNGIEGKWYPVSSNPIESAESLEFSSDGTCSSGGIQLGTWEKDCDRYIVNVLGLMTHVYTIGDYEGYTVLYRDESATPGFAKKADDAEAVYGIINESYE